MDGIGSRDGRESMHLRGQVLRSSADEHETEDDEHEHTREIGAEEKRASVIQEFKRQSGVFFDDFEEGEDTGVSEDDVAVAIVEPPPVLDGRDGRDGRNGHDDKDKNE